MKLIVMTPAVLLFSVMAFAQKTKQVVSDDIYSGIKMVYSVLKADDQVLQGPWNIYSRKGEVMQTGFYHRDLKDSTWSYFLNRKHLLEGTYRDGQQIGEWRAYNTIGELEVQYDYTAKKLLFNNQQQGDSLSYDVINGADTTKLILDRPPIYLNGKTWLLKTIGKAARYPDVARASKKQGYVIVAFTVKEDGKLANYRIDSGLSPDLDKAALIAVASIEGEWLPGIYKGRPVNTKYRVPVKFIIGSTAPMYIPVRLTMNPNVTVQVIY